MAAADGEILVSDALHEALAEADLADRGRHELRGVPGPVTQAWTGFVRP